MKKEFSSIANSQSPRFSIVISTCNRPELLYRCLKKITMQSYDNYEVIIINNGSTSSNNEKYQLFECEFDERFTFYDLNNKMSAGFGPAYARNLGIDVADGDYIAFCDDDDEWIDQDYLSECESYLASTPTQLVISNQYGIHDETTKGREKKIWFTGVDNYLEKSTQGIKRLKHFSYFSEIGAFPHLNTSIYDASFLKELGGFDKNLWYEEDLDLFLRALQKKPSIAFNSHFVANHYIPNKQKMMNVTSDVDSIKKHRLRGVYLQKLINEYGVKQSNDFIKSLASNTFKHLTMNNLSEKDYRTAKMYAFSAHCIKPTFKWFAFFIYISFLGLIREKR
ncbi:glycosyltransferase family 2 protein (plasmid) [Vibrio alfacsensis]|uniref:glycosyltransferase family 2 protein n=1 Tax=Vibrio alfacsensis TaxID=1074311 RepID=UPI002ADE2AFD|nr:glycosyltransferase family 2 protein [Vibrio alfacsensis]WQE79156.1 glycosyltransferase family 2 protein [Vibrio alfacsensis]